MNRSFSPRFAGGLIIIFLLSGGGLFALHRHNVNVSAGLIKARAETAVAAKEPGNAIGYYARYLVLRPGDTTARAQFAVLLADTATNTATRQAAYLALERVLRETPGDVAVRRRAADMALGMDQPTEARFHLEELLKATPADAGILESLGDCEEYAGKTAPAAARYKQSAAADPTRIPVYVKLAAALRRTERGDEATAVMNDMVKANPASPRALVARARYLKDVGILAAAAGDAAAVRAKFGADDADVFLIAAEIATAQGRTTDTRTELERGRQKYPTDMRFALGLIRLDLGNGRREAAAGGLRAAAAVATTVGDIWELADLCISAGETAEARKLTTKLGKNNSLQVAVDFLEARLLMADENWAAAVVRLDHCRPQLARQADLLFRTELFLAECYARLDQPDKRLTAAQAAARINPAAVPARLAVADAKAAAGAVGEALDQYRSLAATVPYAREMAVRIILWQNRAGGPAADWSEATRLLAGAPDAVLQTTAFRLLAASAAAARGDRAEARKLVEAGKAAEPKEVRFWAALAVLEGAERGPAAADAVLIAAESAAGDGVELRLAKAGHWAAQRAADRLKGLEAGADKFTPAERDRLSIGLADGYLAAGVPAEAKRMLAELSARRPNLLSARARLVELNAGDAAALSVLAEEIRRLEGEEGVVWRFADALRQVQIVRTDRSSAAAELARARLAELSARRPQWGKVPLLEGELQELAGLPDAAVEKYLRAVQLGERGPVVRRAAGLLIARRRFDDARRLLAEAAAGTPDAARFETEIAVLRKDDPARTAELLAQAVPADGTDARDLVWRGLVLTSLNRPADAEAAFRRATDVAPAEPVAWVALVEFLARSGKSPDALAAVGRAKDKVPSEQLPRVLASCYAALGDRVAAAAQYEAAARKDPTDSGLARELAGFHLAGGDPDRAEVVLRGLAARGDPSQAAWARRSLALLVAARGDYARGTEALALLDQNLRTNPDAPEDKRARALILAGRPGGRGQSIRLLEESFARLRPTGDEEFLLAQLYEAAGDWPKARERFLGLLAGPGANNPAYLGRFARGLIRQKDAAAAADWVARLEALPGQAGGPRVVELRARLLSAGGKGPDAGRLLVGYADRTFQEKKTPGTLRAVGLLASEIGLAAEAEGLIRRYVAAVGEKMPAARLDLAYLLARQNRTGEALDAVLNGPGLDPEAAARACVATIRLGRATPADADRAGVAIAAFGRAKPASADIRLSAIDLLDANGKYAEAIAGYRAIVESGPTNPLALNNLAWLLALHDRNSPEAVARATAAIAAAGPVDTYLDTLGMVYLRGGRVNDAVREFSAAAEQSLRPEVLFHLAAAHAAAGNVPELRRWFRKATELGLTEQDIHPLERDEYRNLAAAAR